MLRLAVLVSGGGTNLQAILDAIDEGTITNAEVSVVISNNEKHSTRHCWRNCSRTTSISLCSQDAWL